METKVCHKCLKEKPFSEFPWKNITKRTRQTVCKKCTAKRSAAWYASNKQHHIENVSARKKRMRNTARDYVWKYLLEHPCEICGETDPRVLEFHHVSGKKMSVSELIYGVSPIERIVEEMSRCQVLCANCHRRITIEDRGWYRARQ